MWARRFSTDVVHILTDWNFKISVIGIYLTVTFYFYERNWFHLLNGKLLKNLQGSKDIDHSGVTSWICFHKIRAFRKRPCRSSWNVTRSPELRQMAPHRSSQCPASLSMGSRCPVPLRKWKCTMCSSLLCFSGQRRIYLWFCFYLSFVWLQLIPQIFTVTLCSARCWYWNTMATIPIRSPLFWNTHVERLSSNPEKEHLRI